MNYNLQEIASTARLRAYAPYSNFLVGAALLSTSGRIFAGCNVENVSLSVTLCAERVCVGMVFAQEERHFKTIHNSGRLESSNCPLWACQQVLAELAPRLIIVTWTLDWVISEFVLQELLPFPKQGILE
jgi:cytidine deaminase